MKHIKRTSRRGQYFLFCSVFLLAYAAAVSTADDPPGVQEVAVSITVQKPDGTPLEQVPTILLSKAQGRFAFSNANGVATFTIAKVDDEEYIMASMSSVLWFIPPEDRPTAISRYHELQKAYAFKRLYYVPTIGGGPYSFTIQAADAVTVTGRLVDSDANPMEGGIGAEHTVAHDLLWPNDNGQFSLGGITKGQDAVIWYSGGDTPQQHRMVLPGLLLQGDLNLGDITVLNTPLNATVSITSTNFEQMFLKERTNSTLHRT